jgi:hypothetical protein
MAHLFFQRMNILTRRSVYRLFYPASISAALLVSAMAFMLLGPVVGIKSAYVLLGLVLSCGLFYTYNSTDVSESPTPILVPRPRVLGKGVFVLVLLAVTAVPAVQSLGIDVTTAQLAVLLLILPAGYLALVMQIRWKSSSGWILAQILGLFSVTPLLKYQSTGFYAGSGDTPGHVYLIEQVITDGTWQEIPTSSFYHYFPGLHTLFGSTSLLTGLPAYDVYMIAGIVTYSVVICVAYLFSRFLFEERVFALFVALGTSLILPIITHASYFYPQALAVAMGLILLLLSYRGSTNLNRYPAYVILGSLIVGQLWFTHHLTVVLFIPILVALIVGPIFVNWLGHSSDPDATVAVQPALLPLAMWVVGSIAYWVWFGVFIDPFVSSVQDILAGPLIAGGGSQVIPVKALGQQLPDTTISTAVLSIFSPTGIYNLLLVCAVSFAVITVLSQFKRFQRSVTFIVIGVGGTLLLLPTPLVAIGLDRMQLPLSLFVAVVIAIALSRLLLKAEMLSQLAPVLVVFLLLSTSATVAASDEVYVLHSGPDLWEDRPLPEEQVEFSQREMESLEQGSAYLQQHDVEVTTDWRTQIGLERYGTESDSMVVKEGRISVDGDLLMYRNRWPDHSLRLIPEQLSLVTLVVDEAWLERTVLTENKVYTTGEVGMLSDRNGTGKIGG